MTEWQEKQGIIQKFMAEKGIELLHLSNWRNFAWLTGGRQNQVGVLTEERRRDHRASTLEHDNYFIFEGKVRCDANPVLLHISG